MASRIIGRITIFRNDNFDSMQIAKEIGVQPSKIWRLGDRVAQTRMAYDCSGIAIIAEPLVTDHIEEALAGVLGLLPSDYGEVNVKLKKLQVQMEIAFEVSLQDGYPSINLSEESILKIARLGASIDIDLL